MISRPSSRSALFSTSPAPHRSTLPGTRHGGQPCGKYDVFERGAAVKRFVTVSSNDTISMCVAEGEPGICELPDLWVFDVSTPSRPGLPDGVSKMFSEALGPLYADRMAVVCLRLASVREVDDPTKVEDGWPLGPFPSLIAKESRQRLRAAGPSHRHCAQLLDQALEESVHWAIVYSVPNNPRRLSALRPARDQLGFDSIDSALL